MSSVLGFAGLGAAIFALISVIISVALEYWIYTSVEAAGITSKNYQGLWKTCVEVNSNKACVSRDDPSTELEAVRAMVLLALFLVVGGIVCGALKLFMMKENKILGFVTAGLLLAAGLFLIVGFGVYVDKIYNPLKDIADLTNTEAPTLHAGFAFCIIAWIASWVSAALFGVTAVQDKDVVSP